MKRLIAAFVVAVTAASLALATPATAHNGPPVDVFTDVSEVSASVPFGNPCNGAFGIAHVELKVVFHVTAFADGHYSVRGHSVGTWDFEPIVGLAGSGRFVDRFQEHVTSNTEQVTESIRVQGRLVDGERVNFVVGFKYKFANGEVVIDEDISTEC